MSDGPDLRAIYNDLAPVYDQRRFASPYYARVAADEETFVLREVPEGARVIEIGCGTGRFTRKLARKAGHLVVADVSEEMLDVTRQSIGEGVDVRFLQRGFLELPVDLDGKFDVVVSMRLIPHLEDQAGAVDRVSRLLKPGGAAFFDFWNRSSFIGWMRRLARRPMRATIHYRTPRDAAELVGSAGLEIVDCLKWGYPRIGRLSLDAVGGSLAGDFAYSTVFHVVKPDVASH